MLQVFALQSFLQNTSIHAFDLEFSEQKLAKRDPSVESPCGIPRCSDCFDGKVAFGCQTPVSAAAGKSITTIEGLDANGNHPVQRAWRAHNVPQCGYCQSGMILTAVSLLSENPDPTDQQIIDGMSRNICRCGTYQKMFAAVKTAAKEV